MLAIKLAESAAAWSLLSHRMESVEKFATGIESPRMIVSGGIVGNDKG